MSRPRAAGKRGSGSRRGWPSCARRRRTWPTVAAMGVFFAAKITSGALGGRPKVVVRDRRHLLPVRRLLVANAEIGERCRRSTRTLRGVLGLTTLRLLPLPQQL